MINSGKNTNKRSRVQGSIVKVVKVFDFESNAEFIRAFSFLIVNFMLFVAKKV